MFKSREMEVKLEEVLATDSVTKAQKLMRSRSGTWLIAGVSFLESALPLPILTDPFLIAAILVNRKNAFNLVVITTIASVLGGIFAYCTALLFFDVITQLMTTAMNEQFQTLVQSNQTSTFMVTIIGAVTPVPYTLVAWLVAVMKGSLFVFVATSVLGRGLRYCVVGYSVYTFGPLAVTYVKRYIGIISIFIFIGVGIYLWLKM